MNEPGEPVVLATFQSRHEAEMARGILDDAGIVSAVHADDEGRMGPALAFQWRVRLLVAGDEVNSAREFLTETGFLQDIVPPTWSAGPSPGVAGPTLARDLVAMALLFGGVALLVLELFFDVSEDSNTLAYVGAVGLLVGTILTFRAMAESREAKRRTG